MSRGAWPLPTIAWLTIAAFVLMAGSFIVLAQWSGAPPKSTYTPAHIENGKFVPGRRSERAARRGMAQRKSARPPAGGARPRRRGGAHRRRRGAQRADRPAAWRHRHRDHGDPRGGGPPRHRPQASSACRPASSTAPSRWSPRAALRSDDPARGRRDVRAAREGRVRPRLEARRRAARFHHQCAVARARRRSLRLRRRAADLAARRVRFIGDAGDAHRPRIYLRILRFFRFHALPTAKARSIPDGVRACIVSRDGLAQFSRERVRMEMMKLLARAACGSGARGDGGGGHSGRVLGGVPLLASAANMIKLEAALGLARDPVRRLGALAFSSPRMPSGCAAAPADQCGARAARGDGDGWWRLNPAMGEQAARALLYWIGPERFTRSRAARLDALARRRERRRMARARDAAAALERAKISAERGGFSRARNRERPGSRRRAGGGRGSLDRGRFSGRSISARRDRRRGSKASARCVTGSRYSAACSVCASAAPACMVAAMRP